MSPSATTQVDVSHLNDRWSYLVNLTLIGNAVYLSMDIPDSFLGVRVRAESARTSLTCWQMSKLLNYIHYDKTKTAVFTVFIGIWR